MFKFHLNSFRKNVIPYADFEQAIFKSVDQNGLFESQHLKHFFRNELSWRNLNMGKWWYIVKNLIYTWEYSTMPFPHIQNECVVIAILGNSSYKICKSYLNMFFYFKISPF